jgi:hypothetical protein
MNPCVVISDSQAASALDKAASLHLLAGPFLPLSPLLNLSSCLLCKSSQEPLYQKPFLPMMLSWQQPRSNAPFEPELEIMTHPSARMQRDGSVKFHAWDGPAHEQNQER